MELSLKNNEVLAAFVWYATLSILKMMLMSLFVGMTRMATKTFANEEDVRSFGSITKLKDKPAPGSHPRVERGRRAHLNDIENIIPFVLIGLFYVLSDPALESALLHFRLFFGVRVAHTFAYLIPLPQPSRAVFFYAGYFATLSMVYRILMSLMEKQATDALLSDPGFDIKSVEFLLNMRNEPEKGDVNASMPPRGPTMPFTRSKEKKFVSLEHYEEVMDEEVINLRLTIRRLQKEVLIATNKIDQPMDEESLCTICYANEISVEFEPCGHTSCKKCIRQQLMSTRECFYCKATVESFKDLESHPLSQTSSIITFNQAGPSTSH